MYSGCTHTQHGVRDLGGMAAPAARRSIIVGVGGVENFTPASMDPTRRSRMRITFAVWRLGLVTFGAGAVTSVMGRMAIQRYPLTRGSLQAMHAARRAG